MDEEIEKIEYEISEKLKLMSFEERAYRIIRSFYLLQFGMEWDDINDEKIELIKKFSEWFFTPYRAEEKRKALQKVEEMFGEPISEL